MKKREWHYEFHLRFLLHDCITAPDRAGIRSALESLGVSFSIWFRVSGSWHDARGAGKLSHSWLHQRAEMHRKCLRVMSSPQRGHACLSLPRPCLVRTMQGSTCAVSSLVSVTFFSVTVPFLSPCSALVAVHLRTREKRARMKPGTLRSGESSGFILIREGGP